MLTGHSNAGCPECSAAHNGSTQQGDALHLHLQLHQPHHRAPGFQMCQIPLQAPARRRHGCAYQPYLLRYLALERHRVFDCPHLQAFSNSVQSFSRILIMPRGLSRGTRTCLCFCIGYCQRGIMTHSSSQAFAGCLDVVRVPPSDLSQQWHISWNLWSGCCMSACGRVSANCCESREAKAGFSSATGQSCCMCGPSVSDVPPRSIDMSILTLIFDAHAVVTAAAGHLQLELELPTAECTAGIPQLQLKMGHATQLL